MAKLECSVSVNLEYNGPVLNDYLLRIRWNIVILKTIRGYKNKGTLLKVVTPDIIISKLKIDFKF
jgi:hypothetical protein